VVWVVLGSRAHSSLFWWVALDSYMGVVEQGRNWVIQSGEGVDGKE